MASYQYVYVMKDVTKAFPGGREVFKGITLSFLPGVKIGVLGVNGAGKSTLLKIMAGIEKDYGGEAWAAEGVKVGYLEQEPKLDETKTVGENVAEAFGPVLVALHRFNAISERFAEPMKEDEMNDLLTEQAKLQELIDAGNGWEIDRSIEIALDALRCPPAESAVDKLSGGERRRVALARALLARPEVLALDEPTNHLDAETVEWLEVRLRAHAGALLLVTHDRYFLDRVATRILEIDRGKLYAYEGSYTRFLEKQAERLQREEAKERARASFVRNELDWIRRGPQARRRRPPQARPARRGPALRSNCS
jgi:ATPase subunit of ABC transporter with duplicated ATPase domains